ncbi:unnamed protein product, partial [Allacma fusca]
MFHQHDPDDISDPLFFFELGKTEGTGLNVIKTVVLNPDDTFKVTATGANVTGLFPVDINGSVANLNNLLSRVETMNVCSGIVGFESCRYIKGGKKLENNWRSERC